MNKEKILLGLVDDQPIIVNGVVSLLSGDERFQFVFNTIDPIHVIDLLRKQPLDILIIDVMMPGIPGPALAKTVNEHFAELKILALSAGEEGDMVNDMINQCDISGCVTKHIGKQELISALQTVANGHIYFSEDIIAAVQQVSIRKRENEDAGLTEREIEIIRLIEKEYVNKEIAQALFISERTVETHRKNIFRKTKTKSIIGLVRYAQEHQLL